MRVFERDGIERASMRRIAEEAGTTTGAIYPHFQSKEDAYAELLDRSLGDLRESVLAGTAEASDPGERLRGASKAFQHYFEARLFEFELGLYTFRGLARHSLGKERDRRLNASLLAVLDVFRDLIEEAAPGLDAADVCAERDGLFTQLIGALTLLHTGRVLSIRTTVSALVDAYVDRLIARLAEHAPAPKEPRP